MKTIGRILLFFLGLMVLVGAVGELNKQHAGGNSAVSAATTESTAALVQRAIGKLHFQPSWRGIDIRKVEDRTIFLTLNYKSVPRGGMVSIVGDGHEVVQAILDELVAAGRQPSKEWTSVFVYLQMDGLRGATGTPLVRVYGHSYYDFNDDQIKYAAGL